MNGNRTWSYGNYDEVKPTPGVREVLLETIGAHFDYHFEDKDDSKGFVENLQTILPVRF